MTTIESSASFAMSGESVEALLEEERQKSEQLTLKVIALEKDNGLLRDQIADMKADKVKQQLHQETAAADTRRQLATLQVESEMTKKQVAFLEKEAEDLRKALRESSTIIQNNQERRPSTVNEDYQMQIQALVKDKHDLLEELDATQDRNKNQTQLIKQLEAQMKEMKKDTELKLAELQKRLWEEKSINAARNASAPSSGTASQNGSGRFWGGDSPSNSNQVASSSMRSLPMFGWGGEDESAAAAPAALGRNVSQPITRGRSQNQASSLSPVRTRPGLSPTRQASSRLDRLQGGRGAMMREQKNNYMSLRELAQEKRKKCDGKTNDRDILDTNHAADGDDNADGGGGGRWDADMLPDGGAIQQSAQATFLDAAVKKKQQKGFWGKLMGGDEDASVSAGSVASVTSLQHQESTGSLLTREMMFKIRENERMKEEQEKVKRAQEEARQIMEKEKAQKNVKQLKEAVKWGVFTMFKPITETEDEDKRDSNASSVDTAALQQAAAKRTQGMTIDDDNRSSFSSNGSRSSVGSEHQMSRLSVMSELSLPESVMEEGDDEDED